MSTTQHPLTDETLDRLVSYITGGTIDCSSAEGRYDSLTEDDARRIVDSLWGPMTEAAFDAGREHEREHGAQDRPAEITDEMVEAAAREIYARDAPGNDPHKWPQTRTGSADYYRGTAQRALHAALPHHDHRAWEPLNGGPVRVGDEVRRDYQGISRIAIVGHVDADGNPWTDEGILIGGLNIGTWYVRPPAAPTLPNENGAVIAPAEPLARALLAVPEGHGAPHHDAGRIKADDYVMQVTRDGNIRAGRVHYQNGDGDWVTEDGMIITWAQRQADRPDALTVWPAPTPPAEEVEIPTEHPAHLLDVEGLDGDVCDHMALDRFGRWRGVDQVGVPRDWTPHFIAAFTLPDGTRARRDGERPDGEPRFVKTQEEA